MSESSPTAQRSVSGTRRVLFHVHTRYSADAWLSSLQIVRYALDHRIDAVIVTDHDSHLGSVACAKLASNGIPYFPMSAEYRSTEGDMIATFLSRPVSTRDPMGIIHDVHEQGGLVILPHPYKGSRFSDRVFENVDLLEVFNARCSDQHNARASETAVSLGKPGIAGADAHLPAELGLALNEFHTTGQSDWIKITLSCSRSAITAKTTKRLIRQSQMILAIRKLRPVVLAKSCLRWMEASAGETP